MIPDYTRQGIDAYVKERRPIGDFLTAVLTNNLRASFQTADEENRANLFYVVNYCYNEIPSDCWGSPEKVQAWLNHDDPAAAQEALNEARDKRWEEALAPTVEMWNNLSAAQEAADRHRDRMEDR